ncbi:MAG TPA: TIGR04282 family arsenosugar biosynthesis glycosyltransferase [Candidatus Solibacter sp.]|nr:TIGR04282 family arsenosugar biosynthesis glycosyltransferase [Candidatus Solibacter sp.]
MAIPQLDAGVSDILYIAARAPRLGEVKTRLARTVGVAAATYLYVAFLRDIAKNFSRANYEVAWYLTPDGGAPELAAALGTGERLRVRAQGDGGWGVRQDRLFRGAALRGEERVALIASDSPQVGPERVQTAFALLDNHDVVLGPTHDGGYYLVAMGAYHDILRAAPMSAGNTLEAVLAACNPRGLRVATLPAEFDVDEVEDLDDLRAAAARTPGLARTRVVIHNLAAEVPV